MSHDLLKNPLPEPWTFGVTKDGRIFFVNDDKKVTTWLHPETELPMMTGFYSTSNLPKGWQQGFLNDGDPFYINHNKQTTTIHDPKLLISTEKQKDVSSTTPKKRSSSFRDTITKPLYRLSSFQEKPPFSARKNHVHLRKNTVRRDTKVPPRKSGWIFKRDHTSGVKIWRKRWFVLTNLCLLYYKDEKENEALGSIVLPSYQVTTINPDNSIKRKYAFKVEHSGMRSYYLSAESYSEMAKWVAEISKACSFTSEPNASKKIISTLDRNDKEVTDNEEVFEQASSKSSSATNSANASRNSTKLPQKFLEQKDLDSKSSINSNGLNTSGTSANASVSSVKLSPKLPEQKPLDLKGYKDLNTSGSLNYTLPKNFSNTKSSLKLKEPNQDYLSMHSNTLPSEKAQGRNSTFSTTNNVVNDPKQSYKTCINGPIIRPDPSNPGLEANYEIKQVDVIGKKGQYRAFAISRSFSSVAPTIHSQTYGKNVENHSNKSSAGSKGTEVHRNKATSVSKNHCHQIKANKNVEENQQIQSDPMIEADLVESSRTQGSPNQALDTESLSMSPSSSVDTLTAAVLSRIPHPTATQQMNLSRTKSASERLLNRSRFDSRSTQDPAEIKRMQQQINKFRIRSLAGDYYRNGESPHGGSRSHVATDMRTAMRYQRMPKVLRRAKSGPQHTDANGKSSLSDHSYELESDRSEYEIADRKPECSSASDEPVSPSVVEIDIEPDDVQIDLDLTHQLFVPNKVDIPDRLIEYEDVELSPEQEKLKQKKIRAIENLLSKSGQPAYKPPVHLAAALAAEAGTVARAVAHQAHQNKEFQPSFV